jgi:hypothetical protein
MTVIIVIDLSYIMYIDLWMWNKTKLNNFNNIGIRMPNQLPQGIKEIPLLYKFKKTLRTCLLQHCFNSIDEFLLFGAYPSPNHR